MAIAFGAIGAKEITGTTTSAVAYPASVGAGDMALVGRCAWTAANADLQPSVGWTQAGTNDGGTGSSVDSHTTDVGCSYKEMAGGETGTVTFNNGASAGGTVAVMTRYTKGGGESWVTPVFASGDDATHAANRSVTATSSIALAPGDVVVCVVATDTDAALTITAPAITAAGITFGTTTRRSPASAGNTAGTDGNIEIFDATVTSGSGTVAPALAFTTATSQCGPVAFVRLRVTSSTVTGTGSLTASTATVSGSGSLSLTGTAALVASTAILAGTAALGLTGTGSLTASTPALSGAGTITTAVTGTGNLTAGSPALAGSGTLRVTGAGSLTAGNPVLSGAGTLRVTGTGTPTATPATLNGAANLRLDGTGSLTVSAATLAGSGNVGSVIAGTGSLTASQAILSGSGQVRLTGTGGVTATPATLSGSGSSRVNGFGSLTATPAALAGAGSARVSGAGALTAQSPTLTGSGSVTGSGQALEPAPPERTRVLNIGPRHRVLEQTARDRLAQAQDRLSVLPPQNRSGTL